MEEGCCAAEPSMTGMNTVQEARLRNARDVQRASATKMHNSESECTLL